MNENRAAPSHFIRQLIQADLDANRYPQGITTRFPPEPNGYLHIGHAKSICLNFGVAREFAGRCFLRFDDTNPDRESPEFVSAIKQDVQWLGFGWEDRLRHASDYFEQLYGFAVELIKSGHAFVCDLSAEEIRTTRGTLTTPGSNSPFRDRSAEENLDLFSRMRDGEFVEGSRVLRAKIDMSSPNIHLRDPTLYRIRYQTHHNTGDQWCIYPMYDFTHPLSDAIEGVTHSLCTLEFEDNRALYDWVLEHVSAPARPYQTEFSRLSLEYTVVSKRLLTLLVSNQIVSGWDDPRMPTLSGMRRRGFPAEAIVDFCERIGVTRNHQHVELSVLENCVREALDPKVHRALSVLRPLKVVVENYPENQEEFFLAQNHPNDPSLGEREIPFSRELFIEQDDFMEDPPGKFFRLAPGREVRLRYAYLVTCTEVIHDENGNVAEVRCTYDPETRGGNAPDGRKVKGTIHWVSAKHARDATVRLYEPLFNEPQPKVSSEVDLENILNPNSCVVVEKAKIEPSLANAQTGACFQFERLGYFCVDPSSTSSQPVFNRAVGLRDTWARVKNK
ncbi:MAG: glutamine--tRNA ligase/YqeY domain fusion protein [Arenicellales bacterium]